MKKLFISAIPFGTYDTLPLDILDKAGIEYDQNPFGRKMTEGEIAEHAKDAEALIVGSEQITKLIQNSTKLKHIARVGIGLDSVPLELCREKGITVTYTPDAVTEAVGDVTIAAMIDLSRKLTEADRQIRRGEWPRPMGLRLGKAKIGIIGFGRVGTLVYRLLQPFGVSEILVNDISKTAKNNFHSFLTSCPSRWATKKEIYKECDIITIHTPLTSQTKNMITGLEMAMMKNTVNLVNYARGGIMNEGDLYQALKSSQIGGAAIDCFVQEPYSGPLLELDNTLLTQHMGSCSYDCRLAMAMGAAEDVIRYFQGKSFVTPVPESEYQAQRL